MTLLVLLNGSPDAELIDDYDSLVDHSEWDADQDDDDEGDELIEYN